MQWDEGKGSHHPDYNPHAKGEVTKASRETEELLNAIVKVRQQPQNHPAIYRLFTFALV